MSFKIRINEGTRRAEIQIKHLKERNATGIRQAFYAIGKDLKADANKSILETPKHGKLYKVQRLSRSMRHRASAAGEAPANLTGSLRRSLDYNVIGADRLEFGYREKFEGKTGKQGSFYGKYLELGTRKMKPRPALLLSIKKNEGNAIEHFENELSKELNK